MKNPLDQLKPIIEPLEISWFPFAIGWWLAIALVLIVVLSAILILYYIKNSNLTYRTQAKKACKNLKNIKDKQTMAIKINALLKRTALQAYDKKYIASLSGEKWLHFLDASMDKSLFSSEIGRNMLAYIYKNPDNRKAYVHFNLNTLMKITLMWIDSHQPISIKDLTSMQKNLTKNNS